MASSCALMGRPRRCSVPGSFCSHFDSEDGRVGVYTDAVASGFLPGGYACDDGAGVLITDGVLAA